MSDALDRDALLSGMFRDLYVELGASSDRDAIWQMVDWWLADWAERDESEAFHAVVDALNAKDKPMPLGIVVETARRHLRDQQESIENARRGGEYTDRGIGEIRIEVEGEWAQRWRPARCLRPRPRQYRPRRRRVASSPRKARAPDKPDPEPEHDLTVAPGGVSR